MNCQDITRIIDSGKCSALSEQERHDADAHALSCSRCAPLWLAHAHLDAMKIPPLPPDLSTRWPVLVAGGAQAHKRGRARRVTIVVGCVVALAAAAGMLVMSVVNPPSSQRVDIPAISTTQDAAVLLPAGSAATTTQPAAPDTTQQSAARPQGGLPLFPPPYAAERLFSARREMAVEKFVALHPEVTQAPSSGTLYAGSIVLRADGRVLQHAIRTAVPEDLHHTRNDPHKGLPNDGGEPFGNYLPKGFRLADGRTLGADLSLQDVFVSNAYDPARSSLRVEEIIRAERPDLMLPATGEGASHVTVLLSGAGAIQRVVAGYMDGNSLQEQRDWSATRRADTMAGVLGVGKEQIGLMGSVGVFDNDTKRGVFVDYAWQRLAGESAPQYHQGGSRSDDGVDLDTALAVVERVMPDAFLGEDVERALGIPAILLTEEGEFIRTARVRASDPRQHFPGTSIANFRLMVLTNGKGAKSAVYFLWQGTPPAMQDADKPPSPPQP